MSIRVKQRSKDSIMVRCTSETECRALLYLLAQQKKIFPNISVKTIDGKEVIIPDIDIRKEATREIEKPHEDVVEKWYDTAEKEVGVPSSLSMHGKTVDSKKL